jgi:diphosphomevalonate decarboxylase
MTPVVSRRPRSRPRAAEPGTATAVAHANIALSKYWGKSDVALNLPAVPSLSLTLDRLTTTTTVVFDPTLAEDAVILDGRAAQGGELRRVVEALDEVRRHAVIDARARVVSRNAFPTAAGLASSASGFAALVSAAAVAAGEPFDPVVASRRARRASASAARSIFGGFAELPAGRPGQARLAARPVAGEDHWDVRLVVALTAKGPKKVGSTEGMERSRKTSPFYEAWVAAAPALHRRVKRGVRERDLDRVGRAMEQSTLAFHACAMASDPGIFYLRPATLAALDTVHRLREDRGIPVYATMDAGPHVKALCRATDARTVQRALARTEGVLRTMVAAPGPAVEVSAEP